MQTCLNEVIDRCLMKVWFDIICPGNYNDRCVLDTAE